MPEWIEDGVLVTPREDRILPIAARGKRMPELITREAGWWWSRANAATERFKETMATEEKPIDEAQIRQLIDGWAKALRAKDINELMSNYAPEIVAFDIAPPLRYRGADANRKNYEEWFVSWQGPIGYEIRDLSITVGDGVAFSHSLNRIHGKRTNGEETDVWVRVTACFRKINGKWRVAHEHVSVPLYMDGSNRAAVDLKP